MKSICGGNFHLNCLHNAKETTGQTVYEQLQEILIKCIELGWRKGVMHKSFISCDITGIHFMSRDESVEKSEHMSYHDLFSKDSGIMEFVGWKKEEDSFLIISGKGRDRDIWYHNSEYQYMIMGPMTAEEKCNYFVKNARVPTK